jgi:hypothetical protein
MLMLFEVSRGTERRQVEVLMTGQAKLSSVPEVRRAVETSGQTALVDVLEEIGDGEPPRRITVTQNGIGY